MRWLYAVLVAAFAAVVVVFALQNLQTVRMSFLGFSAQAPLAVMAVLVYLLGTVTGSSLFAALRRSFRGAKRRQD